MKTKVLVVVLFFAGWLMCGLSSCVHPTACFTVNVPWDSIHVNKQVTFSALCSEKSAEYFWQFQSTFDSTGDYDVSFNKTFTDTGAVTLSLTVVNGNNSDFAEESFKVIP